MYLCMIILIIGKNKSFTPVLTSDLIRNKFNMKYVLRFFF